AAGANTRWRALIRSLPDRSGFHAAVAFFVAAAWFGAVAPLGVDGHHQGFMARTAVDLLNGRSLFVGTWTWYGPLHAYLNLVGLWVLGNHLWSIQVVTVLGYAVAAAALWRFWQRLGGRTGAWLGVEIFLLSAPEVVRDGAAPIPELVLLPWNSAWALAFTAIAFSLHLHSLDPDAKRPTLVAVLTGVACGLALCTRLPTGAAALLAITLSALVWQLAAGRRTALRNAALAWLGAAGATAVVLIPTALVGGLADAWDQQIVAPRRWAGPSMHTALIDIREALYDALPFAVALALVAVTALALTQAGPNTRRGRVLPIAVIGVVAMFAASLGLGGWPQAVQIVLDSQARWPAALLSLVIIGITAGAGALAFGAPALRPRAEPHDVREPHDLDETRVSQLRLLSGAGLASSALVQLAPVFESRHIWWSTAPLIGVAIAALLMVAQPSGRRLATGALCLALTPLFIAGASGYAERISGPWVTVGGGPFLEGMKVRPPFARDLRPWVRTLEQQIDERPNVAILSYGQDLIWGLIADNTEPVDRYSVQWSVIPDAPAIARFIKRKRPVLWLDGLPRSLVRPYARSLDYCVVRHHAQTTEVATAVLRPCPGPDPAKPLTWKAADGQAPVWAEKIT
ncbi:MAG: glycosyltransferase family 39 protein, partial [Acidimicrobiia bacterium]|nr:glycosyltransferase family 39 protein [Acidimicrobiia bacterium]